MVIFFRGNESATLIKPRYQKLPMLGLGSSVGTPIDGIVGNVIVVEDFDELKIKGNTVRYFKFVNNPFKIL